MKNKHICKRDKRKRGHQGHIQKRPTHVYKRDPHKCTKETCQIIMQRHSPTTVTKETHNDKHKRDPHRHTKETCQIIVASSYILSTSGVQHISAV